MGAVVHPEPAVVHQSYCRDFLLHGICEYFVQEGLEGGPFLMVRIRPDREPVLVALKHIEEMIPNRHGHEKQK